MTVTQYITAPFCIGAPANYRSLFKYDQQISISERVFANPNVHLSYIKQFEIFSKLFVIIIVYYKGGLNHQKMLIIGTEREAGAY